MRGPQKHVRKWSHMQAVPSLATQHVMQRDSVLAMASRIQPDLAITLVALMAKLAHSAA